MIWQLKNLYESIFRLMKNIISNLLKVNADASFLKDNFTHDKKGINMMLAPYL